MNNRLHPESATYGSPLMDQTAEWLVDQALGESDVGRILAGCCERLLAAGVPLSRSYLGYRTLHPLFSGISLVWRRGQELGTYEHLHESAFLGEEWMRSPLYFLRSRELPFLRRRLTGDAVLAIFPIADDAGAARACSRALAAAADARQRMSLVNEERKTSGKEAIEYGLGLHVGDVMYGNIGVAQRLEFSVVGSAANEAARLESLTKTLRQNVLLSEEFVTRLPGPYRSLGQHELRGVGVPVEVFAPSEKTSA